MARLSKPVLQAAMGDQRMIGHPPACPRARARREPVESSVTTVTQTAEGDRTQKPSKSSVTPHKQRQPRPKKLPG